jgi:hypothetical protein
MCDIHHRCMDAPLSVSFSTQRNLKTYEYIHSWSSRVSVMCVITQQKDCSMDVSYLTLGWEHIPVLMSLQITLINEIRVISRYIGTYSVMDVNIFLCL